MILCRSSTCCFGFREQRFDPLPLFFCEVATVSHADQFNHYFVFCIQTLANHGSVPGEITRVPAAQCRQRKFEKKNSQNSVRSAV